MKRILFITEGELHNNHIPVDINYPICHGTLPKSQEESYVNACKIEFEKLLLKIQDLENAKKNLTT